MNRSLVRSGIRVTAILGTLAIVFLFAAALPAKPLQRGKGADAPDVAPQAQTPKVDPKEQADYKAFFNAPDADMKIQLGEDFLAKYPMSQYNEVVYDQLVNAYYMKQNWPKFYSTSDQAIAKYPDDVDVLGLVGWVIPHVYSPDDPDAAKKLDKGEAYEKHALEVIPTLPKPASMTDDQFASAKGEKLSQAHSGLGLIYFRQGNSDDSVKELTQATQAAGSADPTDFYVLGVELQRMNRNAEATDAFTKCSQIPGGLQDRCKQSATQAAAAK